MSSELRVLVIVIEQLMLNRCAVMSGPGSTHMSGPGSTHEQLVVNMREVMMKTYAARDQPTCTQDESEWNVYWASPYSIKQLFSPENGVRLQACVNSY